MEMWVDFGIVLIYLAVVMWVALTLKKPVIETKESYFLSSRSLKWYSVAISSVATNVQGYQFLGMMGSAYLYGLAQANLEITAVQGLLLAAFVFVPLYLKNQVITITQFIKEKLGDKVGLIYSLANIILFSTLGLGAALFWGAYAADLVFSDILIVLSENRFTRLVILIVILGVFSAIYTYFGGLSAVVRTDLIQFFVLTLGGTLVLLASIKHLGGWSQLYTQTPELMHLHLPADHPQLPWIAIVGLFFLNINYWCANQYVVQRSLAARSLKDAQIGLMVGGVMKYYMAIIIVVPGIALAGIMSDTPLTEPDQAFPYLVTHFLPVGLRGIILCALFASLMSTVDSLFNSLATLWSIDIYGVYFNKEANDDQLISVGRQTILVTLCSGIAMAVFLAFSKLANPAEAFTHALNAWRYYINCGIVVLICAAAFFWKPKLNVGVVIFVGTIVINISLQSLFPSMNYFIRALYTITTGLLAYALVTRQSINKMGRGLISFQHFGKNEKRVGTLLLLSLILLNILFH